MSEWLTTGQMIDRLKVGEIAECAHSDWTAQVTKNKLGSIMWIDEEGNKFKHRPYLTMNTGTGKLKWRILPNYVGFEEAMKAHEEGKTVHFHDDGGRSRRLNDYENIYRIEATKLGVYSLIALWKGNWSIGDAP